MGISKEMTDNTEKKKQLNEAETILETDAGEKGGVFSLAEDPVEQVEKPKLLLHSCCGPCSTAVTERLVGSYKLTIFFYNPNITERDEYERRLEAQHKFVDQYNSSPDRVDKIEIFAGKYEPEEFLTAVSGHENDPEGGERCTICYRLRLEKTAEAALLGGHECFASTLSVSPHKDAVILKKLGQDLAMRCGITYLAEDFKKRNGYMRSCELAKAHGLYRQNYCGCRFSKRENK